MTHMVARLVLAMLLFPTAGGAFIVILLSSIRRAGPPSIMGVVLDCLAIYLLVVLYWFLLWRAVVRWTRLRIWRTLAVTVLSLVCGLAVGAVFASINRRLPAQFAVMAGGGIVPILWLLMTVLLWRESPRERLERLTAEGAIPVPCPVCGYSLAGLREARCPECGSNFTLDQLMAAQLERHRAAVS